MQIAVNTATLSAYTVTHSPRSFPTPLADLGMPHPDPTTPANFSVDASRLSGHLAHDSATAARDARLYKQDLSLLSSHLRPRTPTSQPGMDPAQDENHMPKLQALASVLQAHALALAEPQTPLSLAARELRLTPPRSASDSCVRADAEDNAAALGMLLGALPDVRALVLNLVQGRAATHSCAACQADFLRALAPQPRRAVRTLAVDGLVVSHSSAFLVRRAGARRHLPACAL
ncbi:hypothetical protein BV25DRAFT_1821283 [Artomyces pyxidatus]|uniref:Uncharacterized protein n=1 Tax=Artomyces pyxidatus TaxID=48021 RepID=A0ACB8TD79_9AGAM|nr:hypothetical protein BV25DRAFT_1821283 [Artomyces pyxidatus]